MVTEYDLPLIVQRKFQTGNKSFPKLQTRSLTKLAPSVVLSENIFEADR